MSERFTHFSSRIEVITNQGSTNEPDIVQGVAGFPKNGASATEKPTQGRQREQWMASVVHVNPVAAETMVRNELSAVDRKLMVALEQTWKKLKGKYKAPLEQALEEIKNALLNGETQVDILAGNSQTLISIPDITTATRMMNEIAESIRTNPALSVRLNCGEMVRRDKYYRLPVTIVPSSV